MLLFSVLALLLFHFLSMMAMVPKFLSFPSDGWQHQPCAGWGSSKLGPGQNLLGAG